MLKLVFQWLQKEKIINYHFKLLFLIIFSNIQKKNINILHSSVQNKHDRFKYVGHRLN